MRTVVAVAVECRSVPNRRPMKSSDLSDDVAVAAAVVVRPVPGFTRASTGPQSAADEIEGPLRCCFLSFKSERKSNCRRCCCCCRRATSSRVHLSVDGSPISSRWNQVARVKSLIFSSFSVNKKKEVDSRWPLSRPSPMRTVVAVVVVDVVGFETETHTHTHTQREREREEPAGKLHGHSSRLASFVTCCYRPAVVSCLGRTSMSLGPFIFSLSLSFCCCCCFFLGLHRLFSLCSPSFISYLLVVVVVVVFFLFCFFLGTRRERERETEKGRKKKKKKKIVFFLLRVL